MVCNADDPQNEPKSASLPIVVDVSEAPADLFAQRHNRPKEYTLAFLALEMLGFFPYWCSGAFHGVDFGKRIVCISLVVRVEYPKSTSFTVVPAAFCKTSTFCGLISP